MNIFVNVIWIFMLIVFIFDVEFGNVKNCCWVLFLFEFSGVVFVVFLLLGMKLLVVCNDDVKNGIS